MPNADQPEGVAAPRKMDLRCPRCGERDPLPIVYGLPSPPLFEAAERGEVALGGCVLPFASPSWRCRRCGREWAEPPGAQVTALTARQRVRDS